MNAIAKIHAPGILVLLMVTIGHEIVHDYVAYLNGDTTTKRDGRLNINPTSHTDPLGLVFIIVSRFGWTKAVPTSPYAFKKRKLGMVTVFLAGAIYNLVTTFILAGVFGYLYFHPSGNHFIQLLVESPPWYNIILGLSNLAPLPSLDGSKLLVSFLPRSREDKFCQYEKYTYPVLVVAIFSGVIGKALGPIFSWVISLLLSFWGNIFYV